jgi:hypothetical protein
MRSHRVLAAGAAFGARSGILLGLIALAFAVLGLSPSFSWIPEVPLIVAAIIVPVGILAFTGFQASSRSGLTMSGAAAGGQAGAVGGFIGGLAYFLFGKPALNIVVGLLAGAIGGAAIGFLGAVISRRSTRAD